VTDAKRKRSIIVSLRDSPQYYHEVLKQMPPRPAPPFEEEEMQIRVWGRRWGIFDDVGPLKMALVHKPDREIKIMSSEKYDPAFDAIIDVKEQWYYRRKQPPDLAKMQEEHGNLVQALTDEGVEVVYVDGSPRDPKAMYTRDCGVVVEGGVIICRMGPVGDEPGTGRRGEEGYVARKMGEIGMPVLRTINGTGLFEGGSFAWLDENTAVAGMSYRQNEEGTRQIEEVLSTQGKELIRVPLTGHSLHIDGALVMINPDLALVNITRLPYWFLDVLQEKGIHTLEVHYKDNPMVINCLALAPGQVLLATNNGEETANQLTKAGVKIIPIDYSECQFNGGSIHCSTLPLIRERS
jgi:N-dimethylarginine dimethylaminohydrolase